MDEHEEIILSTDEKGWLGKIKDSVYENWQTILVALIVLIVGISAYNYNERPIAPAANEQEQTQGATDTGENAATEQNTEATDAANQQDQQVQAPAENTPAASNQTETKTDTTVTNMNTVDVEGENYKVTATKGDGLTHLARKAMNKYLEANPTDGVTSLHKIYIEDYLRKQVAARPVRVGDEETFSKTMIDQAIAASLKLSQKQLDNLKKYEVQR